MPVLRSHPLSRRNFLKLSGAGLFGLLLTELGVDPALALDSTGINQGRVAYASVTINKEPAAQSDKVLTYKKDDLLNITTEVHGEKGNPYNDVWYRIGELGYVYSGWVQPVKTSFNQPASGIPRGGTLAEVTVPFTDTYRINQQGLFTRSYRMYYQTTHWVTDVVESGNLIWYRLYDDLTGMYAFVLAEHLRLIPPEELTPLSPDVPESDKSILVDLEAQSVTAFEGKTQVLFARASTGTRNSPTWNGKFHTFHKRGSRHMSAGSGAAWFYDLPGVPWVSYITDSGISFHGTYWHNDYGRPHSHGCINLPSETANWIYRWTLPVVPPERRFKYTPGEGTIVQVIHKTPA